MIDDPILASFSCFVFRYGGSLPRRVRDAGLSCLADDRLEAGYEKVALLALTALPKHACREWTNGRWASKLVRNDEIEHTLHDLTGTAYGKVVLTMS